MVMRSLIRRLPPIAWRDAKLDASAAYIRELQEAIRLRGGKVPKRQVAPPHSPGLPGNRGNSASTAVERIAASGLFDNAWYAEQIGALELSKTELIEHYVQSGHRLGMSATPYFLEPWYRDIHKLPDGAGPALAHYLQNRRGVAAVHPLFPLASYRSIFPESAEHQGGILGHYLANDEYSTDMEAAGILPRDVFVQRARLHATRLLETRGHEHLPRQSDAFDFGREAAFKKDLLSDRTLLQHRPVVSIVLPTLNRAHALRVAIQSILEQSYDSWELLIVDDGGTDGTPEVVDEYSFDSRIKFLRHDVNRGVAAARNTALVAATGDYVAYLDSDNTWRPDFLELMLRHLERLDCEAGYSATALVEAGGKNRRAYRGMEFSRDALRERNFIDCIALVHRRDLLARTGPFDESLRRTVDWDLLIRIAENTTPVYAPFIGSEYDLWESTGDRITTEVTEGYRHRVRQRTLVDWDAVRESAEAAKEGLSVVLVVTRPAAEACEFVHRIVETTPLACEIIVVDNHLPDHQSILLAEGLTDVAAARVVRTPQVLTLELARNFGASSARYQSLIFIHERLWTFDGWAGPLVEALHDAVAAQPLILGLGGEVWSAGTSFASGRAVPRLAGLASDAPEVRAGGPVDAVSHACIAVRLNEFAAIEGFDPLFVTYVDGADLSLRLRDRTGHDVRFVAESAVAFRSELPPAKTRARSQLEVLNERELTNLWAATTSPQVRESINGSLELSGYRRDTAVRSGLLPVYVRARESKPLRWAIKIGTQFAYERENWGDFHFAESLRDALEALGHTVTIDPRGAWYRPTAHLDDVVLVLQGRGRYHPSPHQVAALWMISHPSEIVPDDLADFDLVFGASEIWCRRVDQYLRRPARLLLQCTDPTRFRPVAADPAYRHEVLMVGNARGMRRSIEAALHAGLTPAVYGKKWESLLPDGVWRGSYIPNRELARYYSSAGVVLNDHWAEMAEWGMLSNRLFDLMACGARVVSDDVPGIQAVFGDYVARFTTPNELGVEVSRLLAESPQERDSRLAFAETVRREHSFAARAFSISNAVSDAIAEREQSTVRGRMCTARGNGGEDA